MHCWKHKRPFSCIVGLGLVENHWISSGGLFAVFEISIRQKINRQIRINSECDFKQFEWKAKPRYDTFVENTKKRTIKLFTCQTRFSVPTLLCDRLHILRSDKSEIEVVSFHLEHARFVLDVYSYYTHLSLIAGTGPIWGARESGGREQVYITKVNWVGIINYKWKQRDK